MRGSCLLTPSTLFSLSHDPVNLMSVHQAECPLNISQFLVVTGVNRWAIAAIGNPATEGGRSAPVHIRMVKISVGPAAPHEPRTPCGRLYGPKDSAIDLISENSMNLITNIEEEADSSAYIYQLPMPPYVTYHVRDHRTSSRDTMVRLLSTVSIPTLSSRDL